MKAPWPKLITSIRPNTSVRPDAMTKIIMPIASPATVSVTQVRGDADQRQRRRAPAIAGSSSGSRSPRRLRQRGARCAAHGRRSLMRLQAEARAACPAAPRRRPASAMRAGVHDAAVVHHRDGVAERLREAEVLLDQQDRRVASLQFARTPRSCASMIAGARPLVGSSIRISRRGSMMARAIDSICFCPPDSSPAGRSRTS